MSDLAKAKALAEKIQKRADEALRPLAREMLVMQWPAEYRAIMWQAVAEEAMRRSVAEATP